MQFDGSIGFQQDDRGIDSFSQDLSHRLIDEVGSAVRRAVSEALPDLGAAARSRLADAARARLASRLDESARSHPNFGNSLVGGTRGDRRISEAVRHVVDAIADREQGGLGDTAGAASSAVEAARARGRTRLQQAVARAERQLARRISRAIENVIPESISGR
jgi:hypothetical protein